MSQELMPLTNVNAVAIFQEGGLDELLKQIHAEAESHVPDLTTDKGRKAIASIAAKVAKSKTYLDGLGKDMVAGWKNQAKVVDAERRKMRDDLDELKISIRQPLTDYENTENERVDHIQSVIAEIAILGTTAETEWVQLTLDEIKYFMEKANKLYRENEFDEQGSYAVEVIKKAKEKIIGAMDQREKYDKERADLDRLRNEAAVREQKEREALLEKEREEREKQIAENAKHKAEERERQAIKDKEDAQKRAELAEQDAIDANERAEQDARDKLAREQQAELEAAKRREADVKHRRTINAKAVEALMKTGLDADQAKKVVTAIAKHKVPNITIAY